MKQDLALMGSQRYSETEIVSNNISKIFLIQTWVCQNVFKKV